MGWSKRGDTIVEETYLDDSSGQNTYLLTADASALAGLLNTIEKIAIEGAYTQQGSAFVVLAIDVSSTGIISDQMSPDCPDTSA